MLLVLSSSLALAVTPTKVPAALFSTTVLVEALVSIGVVTANLLTSVTATEIVLIAEEPSAEVALM